MIISHSRNFIYVHIHKCAGESIERALWPYLGLRDILIGARPMNLSRLLNPLHERRTGLVKHSKAADIRAVLGHEAYDAAFRFATVRHPVKRIYSLYTYAIGLFRNSPDSRAIVSHPDVIDHEWPVIVDDVAAVLRRQDCFAPKRGFYSDHPAAPDVFLRHPLRYTPVQLALLCPDFQSFVTDPRFPMIKGTGHMRDFLCDPDGGELLVDRVVKLETLSEEWPEIAEQIQGPESLPRSNGSADGSLPPLTGMAASVLEDHYRTDIDFFGYEKNAVAV
ncbi:MAG: sulfotransferase family 2 domain-containing protein [Pseudomonadota bacterium]